MQEQPTPPQEDTRARLTRRRLVRLGWITAVLMWWEGNSGSSSNSSSAHHQGKGEAVCACCLDSFPWAAPSIFGKAVYCHHPTGVLALSDECTHLKCTVDYLPERQVIFCPCHSAQFSTTGAVLAGPAPRPLDRFAITVQDGQIVVDTRSG